MKKIIALTALLFPFSVLAATEINGTEINLKANEQPITTAANPTAIAKLPKGLKLAHPGEFTVGISGEGAAPLTVYAEDNKTLIGSEPDIARLVASALGLKLRIIVTSWEDWPLGVTSGKYDAAISNITVTKARKEKFDFATYRKDLLGFYVPTHSTITAITRAEEIAGKRIIVGSGTNQEAILLAWNQQNIHAGLPPVTPVYMTSSAAQALALQSGRADAWFGPNVNGAWQAAKTGRTHLVGNVDGGWPQAAHIAVTLKKGNDLAPAVAAAIDGAIKEGSYQRVLNRWGEGVEAIPASEVNPAGLGD
ncbi:ABC transporter substrate-binding protein [Rosenbergiella nectarea]|uniref:ABC transporter substrate-binding protein n=1 Tax=Rosenbergiella nectarea TaxID=988801 RepID=UPI001F4DF9A1|nr:ABC transporter substrate-binding protein [Rosenbergiella nectarea]